jgi:protein required for attachment to host cells
MDKLKIEAGEWVVVCDGRKALILENAGDQAFPNLKTREVREHDDPPTHELGTGAPGRTYSAAVTGSTKRSAMEQTDWHDLAERAFLQGLARRLDAAINRGEMPAFYLVAPARALGVLRKEFSAAVNKKLRGEIERDYVKIPVAEIEKRLFGSA